MRKASLTLAFLSFFSIPIVSGNCSITCTEVETCREEAVDCSVEPGDPENGEPETLVCHYPGEVEIVSCRGDIIEEG